jgi:hypothetical protein
MDIGTLLLSSLASAVAPVAVAELRCPPRLPGPHPGFEQVGPIPAAHWLLWRMQLFDAAHGKAAPKELAPNQMIEQHNGFTLTWLLAGTEDLTIVCLYNGSATYYMAHPRPAPALCTMRNDNGLTQGSCEIP